jgi:hypothetical protein
MVVESMERTACNAWEGNGRGGSPTMTPTSPLTRLPTAHLPPTIVCTLDDVTDAHIGRAVFAVHCSPPQTQPIPWILPHRHSNDPTARRHRLSCGPLNVFGCCRRIPVIQTSSCGRYWFFSFVFHDDDYWLRSETQNPSLNFCTII